MIELGMSDAAFRAGCLERACLHRRAALQVAAPSWPEVDALLHAVQPQVPYVQLFHRARLLDPALYIEERVHLGLRQRRLDRGRLYGCLLGGASLVLNRVEDFLPLASCLCGDLAGRMQCPASANAYLSLREQGSTTFGTHWDTHDVFVVQLLGRKRWRVYEPTLELPLPAQTSLRVGDRRPETPVLDCILEPGDLLYVPRGWWHEVEAFGSASFHLSIGLYPPLLFDYLQWVVSRCLHGSLPVRQRFAAGAGRETWRPVLDALANALADPAHRAAFAQEMQGHLATPPAFDLALVSGDARLHGSDVARLTAPRPGSVAAGGADADARPRLEANEAAIVSALAGAGPMTIGDLQRGLAAVAPQAVSDAVLGLLVRQVVAVDRREGAELPQGK